MKDVSSCPYICFSTLLSTFNSDQIENVLILFDVLMQLHQLI